MAETFKLMGSDKQYDIFKLLQKEDYSRVRKRIVHCVLATDMTLHTGQYAFLKLKIENLDISEGKNIESLFSPKDTPADEFNTQKEFLNVLLHASDISNPARPRDLSQKWLDMLCDEFYAQGDKERELKLPISFMCDRFNTNLPKMQIGFISGIILPLFDTIKEFFPELAFFSENAKTNLDHFKKLEST